MGKHIHYKIAGWLKIIVVVAFVVNTVRILVRTWKYGGAKSAVSINYDDMPNAEDPETVEEM